MKRLFVLFLTIMTFTGLCAFSQEDESASQVVLPIEVFVGDHAEIRYTFRSAIDFFPGEGELERKDLVNPYEGLEDSFSVVKAELYRTDMEYTVRFVIVPWKVGTIAFPAFNLNTALGISAQKDKNAESEEALEPEFNVALYPVQIKSIVEKTDNRQMMPPAPPIIIPGTTYVIFLLVLSAVVILILFFRILLKFNSIRQKWNRYLQKRAYKKNAEETIKKIKKLAKIKVSDIEFCSTLQLVTRKYLDFRFSRPFSAISSTSIRKIFEDICLGEIPSEISAAVDDLTAMFIRTDYIRYAHDSIDSQLYPPAEHQAALVKHERKTLSEMVVKAINVFESDEEDAADEHTEVSNANQEDDHVS